jgi:hypothetical protein
MILLTACDAPDERPADIVPEPEAAPEQAFWDRLSALCDQAFAGEPVSLRPGDDSFDGKDIIMDVRHCEDSRILIPLHVGDDRSRIWIFERRADGLTLKHDHRGPDGDPQDITGYGGKTDLSGADGRREFPVDAETVAMLPNAVGGVWTVEIEAGESFAYQVHRKGAEHVFRIRFDLTEPVEAPPAPWGWSAVR